jgi:choline dehydrogenase
MRWVFFVKCHSDDAVTKPFNHLTWRTSDGQFYVGCNPPAGATMLGVYYPRAATFGRDALCAALPSDSDWQFIANVTGNDSWK